MDQSKYDQLTDNLRDIADGLQALQRARETTIHLHLTADGTTIPLTDLKLRTAVIDLVCTHEQKAQETARKELSEFLSAL